MVNRNIKLLSAYVGALSLIVGCEKTVEAPPTVDWYLKHPEAMAAKVAWCSDDLQRQQGADCMNALVASGRKQLGSMKDLPPIDWNKPDTQKP